MTERLLTDMAREYTSLASALQGFTHTDSLDTEFKVMHSLEEELFGKGRIKEDPNLLLHMDITIGATDDESKVSGVVLGVETTPDKKLLAVIVKGHGKVDYTEGQTVILPHKESVRS